ncbi:unnamed protein product [Schistosoma curassoni]|uniref:Flocculation protein FLO11-like n=1 Tax=Schistosoma curassoni TaxID=6186 RepID=A0A183K446_9TREM|nr:unnamed protein product [Schistosoma curassoni]
MEYELFFKCYRLNRKYGKNTERLQKHQAYWNRVELAAQKAKQPSVNFPVSVRTPSFTTDYASLPGTSNTLGSSSVVTSLSNIPPESSTAIITSVSSVLLTSSKSNSQVIQRQQQSSQMLNPTDNNTRSNTTVNSSTSVSNLNKKLSSPKASTSITYTARKPMSSLQKQPLRSNTSLTANKDTLSSSAVSSGQITSGTNSSTIKTERSTNLRRTTTLRSLNT